MKLRLKENPREWQKFTASVSVLLAIVAWFLTKHEVLPIPLWLGWTFPGAMLLMCLVRPQWFRGFYRKGMAAGFCVGQMVGKFLLAIFFLILLTPTGLLLRLFGKDLLMLKRGSGVPTYWVESKKDGDLDRQF